MYERDSEYNRDLFVYPYENTKLEIFVDYYTLRFVWWYKANKKVGTSFRLQNLNDVSINFINDVIAKLKTNYNII